MSTKDIIKSVLNNDEGVLEDLYLECREQFLLWIVLDYNIRKEDAKDLFQDAMVIFVMKVQKGEITTLNSSVKTYIYGVGKQLIKNQTKTKCNREFRHLQYYTRTDKYNNNQVDNEKLDLIIAEINGMQNPCKSILQQFYFDYLTLEEIALYLGCKSSKSVKVQKYRCLNTLKDKIFNIKVNK